MTPFEKAGYTKDTKFRVLIPWQGLNKGDIVTLDEDDGSICIRFKTQDQREGYMTLPGIGINKDLEVYEEPKELTPFEKAGYTKDTKFKVLVDSINLEAGDIVTLDCDDTSICPLFKTEDNRDGYMFLPGSVVYGMSENLEVYEESNTLPLQQRVEALEKELKQIKEGILNACAN